ncbi:MAG: ABC transporter permease [Anaerolineales bacterium]|nr:ABC transporter permease [Anaerolineales bacterium]
MLWYLGRRLLSLPLTILVVTLVLFFLILQLPVEERAKVYMPTMRPNASEEQEQELLQRAIDHYGLDKPFPVQYVSWLRNLVSGEWGYSPTWRQPVLDGLLQRAPASAELALAAMIPAVVLALALGSLASRRSGRLPDHLVRAAAFVAWAMPAFVSALVLINLLYAWLGWFPPGRLSTWANQIVEAKEFRTVTGMVTVDALLNNQPKVWLDAARHLVLPAFTLALAQWALLARVMRSSLLEALSQDYVTTARAKGVPERRVVNLHARRNAITPVISTGGVTVAMLISTMVVVESVFAFDGLGSAATEAMWNGDVQTVVGFTLLSCIVAVLSSFAADVLCWLVDPRMRPTGALVR